MELFLEFIADLCITFRVEYGNHVDDVFVHNGFVWARNPVLGDRYHANHRAKEDFPLMFSQAMRFKAWSIDYDEPLTLSY